MNQNYDNFCGCLSECIDKTDKVNILSKSSPSVFSVKERQFFLLLSNHDCFSKKATSHLMTKVPLNYMLETGLVKQTKDCENFQNLLSQYQSENQKNKPANNNQSVIQPMSSHHNNLSPQLKLLAGL